MLSRLIRPGALALMLCAAGGSLGAQSLTDLAPGDVVQIAVWRQPELSGEFEVAADGTLVHPIYREVRVTDVPMDVVEQRIRTLLSRYESDPRFSIQPLVRVAVGGEVREPSLYTIPTGTSVAQVVALAGGATERGRLSQVRLYRAGEVLDVDLTNPDGALSQSMVRSGDRIVVSRRTFILRDYLGPIASLTSVAVAIAGLIMNAGN